MLIIGKAGDAEYSANSYASHQREPLQEANCVPVPVSVVARHYA